MGSMRRRRKTKPSRQTAAMAKVAIRPITRGSRKEPMPPPPPPCVVGGVDVGGGEPVPPPLLLD